MPFLSVIIPAYNEEKRIKKTLFDLRYYFERQRFDYEVIIVDDGSKDRTFQVIKNVIRAWKNFYLLGYKDNRGKGAAIKYGVQHSHGDWILFIDADGSTPVIEFNNFKPYLGRFPVIIGSRYLKKGSIKKKQPFFRVVIARLSNWVIRRILGLGFKDTQCGFKLFKRPVALKLFTAMTLNRWGFDFELLVLAERYKIPVKEVAVSWYNEEGSQVKFGAILNTLWELLKVRGGLWRNRYP